jgi:hypothetical protein
MATAETARACLASDETENHAVVHMTTLYCGATASLKVQNKRQLNKKGPPPLSRFLMTSSLNLGGTYSWY